MNKVGNGVIGTSGRLLLFPKASKNVYWNLAERNGSQKEADLNKGDDAHIPTIVQQR